MDCVKHYVDSLDSLQGFRDFFIRIHGIVTIVIINLACGGIFVWIDKTRQLFSQSIDFPVGWLLLSYVGFISFILLPFLLYVRLKYYKLICLQKHLHQFAHYLRDRHAKTEEIVKETTKPLTKLQTEDNFRTYCNGICNEIRDYFKELTGDSTVCCALRVADKESDDPADPVVVYSTAGRSRGFTPSRNETSQPITANKGVPSFFLDRKGCQGVLIYYDIKKAVAEEAFVQTINEEKYNADIKTFMVAPINGWSGCMKTMIGLLYVTSKKSPFGKKYVDSIKMFADLLGESIPKIVELSFDKGLRKFA
jgi:hypothetical protein